MIARTLLGLALLGATVAAAAAEPPPAYVPRPVAAPAGASYLTGDGAVTIVGNDGLQDVIDRLDALFVRHHPQVRFATVMRGSSTGMPALAAGATLFAPLTRDMWPGDRAAFRQLHGYDATPVRIGYNGYGPRPPHKTPPAVYVHADNPLAGLTLAQVARIFTDGQDGGDLATWSQLGLDDGAWADRRIHAYGLRDDGGFATGLRIARLGGRPFALKYEALPSREAVIRAVAADRYGIGLLGWIDAAAVSSQVRVLPLAQAPGEPFHGPDHASVRQGRYPLSAAVQFYVDRAPDRPLDPLVKEYLRLALSREGQALLEAQRDAEEGYVPLSAEDLARERQRLEAL
ncbi:PstS family phosphate ABC transporter substrate-binding protein [Xanthomonas theicola]|uniref:Phosphate-binding protein n=1 Tax=Xanthomonas theicola TaxID=56464 RepID=A0A2S6ZL16_9XANT|nr:substrate-binding domain-containing protein [Xanthomonas theicola]PPT92935.1 phosphate-binding protein [Xanthomonas theicola]QNH23747.1 phosphate-binding protein [Xanthomonas theicola]